MGKKWTILLCFFSMLTFASSLLCTSLTIYNLNLQANNSSNSIVATKNIYKNTQIVYEESNTFGIEGMNPGDKVSKTFTITNNNSDTIKYSVKWYDINSNWNQDLQGLGYVKPEEFVYTMNCTDGTKKTIEQVPLKSDDKTYILKKTELKNNKSNTCTITLEFIATGEDQTYNLNRNFGGTYKVIVEK